MELEGKEQVNPNKRKEISPPKVRRRAKNMACHICLTREHWSSSCPYILKYPPGAIVGPFARILCLCCGEVMPHPGDPGVDWEARVDLKACFNYPSIEEQLMELKKAASASDSATSHGTGNNERSPKGAAYSGTGKAIRRKA